MASMMLTVDPQKEDTVCVYMNILYTEYQWSFQAQYPLDFKADLRRTHESYTTDVCVMLHNVW